MTERLCFKEEFAFVFSYNDILEKLIEKYPQTFWKITEIKSNKWMTGRIVKYYIF